MPKFNPVRLKEARIYRKLTIEELATKAQVSKQAISQYENGKNAPDFENLKTIASSLSFPIAYFFEEPQNAVTVGNTYFRALFSSNKKDLNSQVVKTSYVPQVRRCLEQYVDFMPLKLPSVDETIDVEDAAAIARKFWGLNQEPINDMVALLEQNGIIVSEFATDDEKIDAFTQYIELDGYGNYSVILGTEKKSSARRQFNCAHELGHILLHEKFEDLSAINRDDFRRRENEANRFASALLLPADAFSKDVGIFGNKLMYYVDLKKKWKVSISSMIMRAHHLELISQNQYQYLMRQISYKGWRNQEPLDDIIPIHHPKALRQAVNLILMNNILDGDELLQLLSDSGISFPKDVIDEILGLEPDTLVVKKKNPKVIEFAQLKDNADDN